MTKNNNLHRVHCILASRWHIPVKTATNMKTFFKKLCRELRVFTTYSYCFQRCVETW